MDDDGTGWHEVLVGGWSDEVRDAVVRRVERATIGWRGPLVRTLTEADDAPAAWTEAVHRLVVTAIAEETGADLDELGSHAAWACYEEVWQALTSRWEDGGDLAVVPLGQEPAIVRLLLGLSPLAAQAAGAVASGPAPDPLWLGGRLRVDLAGLRRALADPTLPSVDEVRIEALLGRFDADV